MTQDDGQAETPMRDHVERFFRLLETEHVRILVDIRREHDEGQPPHWDSASFPNDVAKAIAASIRSPAPVGLGEEEIAKVICRAYCGLHKRAAGWDALTLTQQDAEVDCQFDLWLTEARAVISYINRLSRLSQTPAPAGGGGEHRVGDYIADYSMPTREQINAPDPELDALLRRSIIASSEPAPELMTPAPSPMVTEEEAMHVFCNAANLHLTCSYPECKCKIHPTGVRALLALIHSRSTPSPDSVAQSSSIREA